MAAAALPRVFVPPVKQQVHTAAAFPAATSTQLLTRWHLHLSVGVSILHHDDVVWLEEWPPAVSTEEVLSRSARHGSAHVQCALGSPFTDARTWCCEWPMPRCGCSHGPVCQALAQSHDQALTTARESPGF